MMSDLWVKVKEVAQRCQEGDRERNGVQTLSSNINIWQDSRINIILGAINYFVCVLVTTCSEHKAHGWWMILDDQTVAL